MKNNIIRFSISTVINIAYLVFYWFIGYEINTPVHNSRQYYIFILIIFGIAVLIVHLLVNLLLKNIKVSDELISLFWAYTFLGIIPYSWMILCAIIYAIFSSPLGIIIVFIILYKRLKR